MSAFVYDSIDFGPKCTPFWLPGFYNTFAKHYIYYIFSGSPTCANSKLSQLVKELYLAKKIV
jgi:hypothetical protein